MQFVFYALLEGNSERIDIGSSEEERAEYADTALYTAFVYVGFVHKQTLSMSFPLRLISMVFSRDL